MQEGTHSFIYIHTIWATRNREKLLTPILRKVLFPALIQSAGAGGIQLTGINGVEDHIHALVKLMPAQNIAEVIRQIKEISSGWLNNGRLLQQAFEWDGDYAAYSVSPSTIDKSIEYLNRQEAYHTTRSLDEELTAFGKMAAQTI